MSLARTCLRLAAVAALRDATLAQERVFDSRIGSVDGFRPEERKSVVAVYTEDQAGEALSVQNGGPPFKPHVDLTFELSMVEAQYDEAGAITDIGCPTTDKELEASLDTLEQQIRVVLFEDMSRPLSILFRKAFLRATHFQSLRFREEKSGARLAFRYVIVKLEVADEPVLLSYEVCAPAGLDRLPKTFAAIAAAWPDDLPEKDIAKAIAAAMPAPILARGITLEADAKVGAAHALSVTPARGNKGNGTLSLDGVDPAASAGNYVVKFTDPTSYKLWGPGLRFLGAGVIGEPFISVLSFLIDAGPQPFAADDCITIVLAATALDAIPLLPT